MRYTNRKSALRTLRTRLTTLSSALVLLITGLSGAAPLFLTQTAYANNAPSVTAPVQATPADGANLTDGNVTLTWSASTSTPNGSALEYTIGLSTSSVANPDGSLTNSGGTTTSGLSYQPSGTLQPGTWYWNVKACIGNSANCSDWSPTESFTVLPAATPVLGAENFNTVNDGTYKGISVGFNAKDFTDISAVTVDMTRSDGTHAVKHGTSDLFSLIEANASPYQFTAPFVIQSGSYDPATDSYWTSDPTTWSATTVPSSVTITITYQNGLTEHVTNSTFDAGPLSWPTYDSLLPPAKPAAPTDLTIAYDGAASNLAANTDGNYVVRNVSKNIKLSWVNDPGADITGVRTHVVFPDGTSQDFSQGTPYTYTNLNPRDSGNKFAADGAGKYTYTVEVKNATGWSAYSAPLVIYYAPNIPTATFKTAPPSYVNGNFQVTIVGSDTGVLQDVGADVRDPSAPAGTNSYVTGCTNGQLLGGATLPAYSDDGSGVAVEETCTINTANFVNGHTYTLRARASFIEADGQSYGNVNSGSTWTFTYDTSKPVISNLKAVVNNSKTYNLTTKNTPLLVKSGDSVTVTIQVDGTGSPVDWAKVRAYEQNVAAGNWHTYLFPDQTMTDNHDGTYSYTFVVPDQYTTGDSINQNPYKNAIDFNTKDEAGNTHGTELYFTIDNTAPTMDLRYGENGAIIPSGSTINNTGQNIRIDKENTATIHVTKPDGSTWSGGKKDADYSGGKLSMDWLFTQDGTYTFYVEDEAGNVSGDYRITIDTAAPAAPTIKTPAARQWFKSTPIVDSWTAVTMDVNGGTEHVDHYQVAYAYDDGHGFGSSTCTGVSIGSVNVYCRDATGTSRNHMPASTEQGGVTIWVRAIDKAGNEGAWSKSVHYYYDDTNPATTIAVTSLNANNAANTSFTVEGDASDNLSLNRVYVQLVNRQTGQRYGGVTINLIPNGINPSGVSAHWSHTYDIVTLGLPDGTYAANVEAVDMAGNTFDPGWTADFAVDSTDPTKPAANPAGGDYVGPQQVSLDTSDNSGGSGIASIYYTTDGTTPSDTNGELYNGPITVSVDTTLKAIAYDEAGNASPVMTDTYGIAPIITGEAALTPTTSSITLQWDTNEPATSRVIYDTVSHASLGTAPNYGYAFSTVEDSNKVTPHSVTITGLTPGTQYYFRMVSHGSPEAVSTEVSSITKVQSKDNKTTYHVNFTPSANSGDGQAGTNGTNTPTVTPQVLGASTTDGTTNGNKTATFASDVKAQNDAGKGSNFLGLGWWWLVVLAALLAFYLFVIRRSDSDEKNSN